MTAGNETTPPVPLPNVIHYEDRYADAIFPLATLMSDGADYNKEHWTYNVKADELTQTDLSKMEGHGNEKIKSIGEKWMDAAEKHPEKHDVLVLQGNTDQRIKELGDAIIKMQTSYDTARKHLESKNGSNGNGNRSGFPGPTVNFRGSGSASNNRRQGASSFNTSGSSTNNTSASGNADATAGATAYTSGFFKDGNLADLVSTTPASDKPLKLASQPIEKFDWDVTKFPVFRHQFLRAAHRSKDTDDIDRFFYLLSLLDGPAKQLVGGIAPLPGCYERACETLQLRYGDPDEICRQLLGELKQLKPLQTGCSADQIEKFTNKFVQCLASIEELGRADTSGRTLEELEEKLPPDLREKIQGRRRCDPNWNEVDLHHFLLERAAILRAIHGDKGRSSAQDTSKVKTAVATAAKPRDDFRRSGAPPGRNRMQTPNMECVFYPSNDHGDQKLGKCYICLNKHKADSCRSATARDCRLCNEKHHIIFCPVRYENEKKASKTHSSTINEDDKDYNEPDSSADASDQASSDADDFDDATQQKKVHFQEEESHGTHAILSNKDNGSHQTTLLECVE
ncbi:integrase core domain protein, partial [Aphelenchoides avenae]